MIDHVDGAVKVYPDYFDNLTLSENEGKTTWNYVDLGVWWVDVPGGPENNWQSLQWGAGDETNGAVDFWVCACQQASGVKGLQRIWEWSG